MALQGRGLAAHPMLEETRGFLPGGVIGESAISGHAMGWFTRPHGMLPRGDILPDTTFGHTGFTGNLITIEPSSGLIVVFLTNRVVNPDDNGSMMRIRRRVLNAVASAITI